MLTAAYLGNRTVAVRDASPTAPGPGEVRVRVAYVGLCGTDLHVAHGDMERRVRTPLVFGHEMSGVVDAVGDGVEGWRAGDLVTVMPLLWDGTCPACRAGNSHVCQNLTFIGIDSPGALQALWNVPGSTLVRMPADVEPRHAALVEPVAVAVHDVRRGGVSAGDAVVVLGGGPIGTLIACVAAHAGARVVVVEPDPSRRELVQDLGFRAVGPEEIGPEVERWTAGAGADVVFEVSGSAAAVAAATGLAKVRGTLVVVAIHPEPRPVDLQRVFWRELTLVGARVYERVDFERAVELVAAGVVPAERLITRVVPLTEVNGALDDLGAGRAMKILVDVQAGQPEEVRA
ncbi:MAG: Zn-dependent alcohol dehydrogenase [Cellulomonas sp. 73-145]|uniref:zinc-dependent alcohol dehydrogenase n=1 Tax=Cellulomonas sp. 73-145 TaxID=1895739 RepID=UPI00092BF922|nr:alcohol dehydrogenase catalytic domain-containing protein [Cellulomonas sp. 73-145]OJV59839.1 MAG: Zn-dependent alcohol dehydrogenase [Cellulomonas sp. 73-145]